MKVAAAIPPPILAVVALAASSYSYAFRIQFPSPSLPCIHRFKDSNFPSECHLKLSSMSLFAKKPTGASGGMGFGSTSNNNNGSSKGKKGSKPPPKYSIVDKSYDISPTVAAESFEEAQSSMNDFFTTFHDWKPLFHNVMMTKTTQSTEMTPLAHSFLAQDEPKDIWDISTLEGRTPWRLLPPKPSDPTHLETLSNFLDEWQRSLLDIPIDALVKEGSNDLHFLEEGRRTIAVTRFHVLPEMGSGDDSVSMIGGKLNELEEAMFTTCWSELAHLTSQDASDTGSLIVLPSLDDHMGDEGQIGLDYLRDFVQRTLIRPIQWLGREEDWEIVAMERGNLAIRLLYKLSDIPDLSERDTSGDGAFGA